jgi:uncharacterized UPF0160 family protein
MKETVERVLAMLVLVGLGVIVGLALAKFQRLEQPFMLIATHDGTPHADDIFAVAILLLVHPQADVIRTRDKDLLQTADIRVDVGMEYNPPTDFDHHMPYFNMTRPDGRPYASAGLVSYCYWEDFVGDREVFNRFDDKLIAFIDATDSGVETYIPISPHRIFDLHTLLYGFIPTAIDLAGKTRAERDSAMHQAFMTLVGQAQGIIGRELNKIECWVKDQDLVCRAVEASRQADPRFIILKRHASWGEIVSRHPDILFVIFYDETAENWVIQTVPEPGDRFTSKKLLPADWAGKEGPEFVRTTGIPDAVFCHRARFQARAKTKESILEMADRVLD